MNQPSTQFPHVVIPRSEHSISRAAISPNALKVLYRLKEAGYQGFLVGGAVRDLLLGITPKDFDVATNALPEEVRRLFRNSRLIGRRFRLAHVHFGHEIIEVATFRAAASPEREDDEEEADAELDVEEANSDSDSDSDTEAAAPVTVPDDPAHRAFDTTGRILRDNIYGTIEEDVWRRDFAANGLYYNIDDFSIWDFVDGVGDVRARRLKLIGDPETRYREDPVRMLRAVRFAARFEYAIEPRTFAAMQKLAHQIEVVSRERVRDELTRMLTEGHARRAFLLLDESGLLRHVLPEVSAMKGVEQPPEFHPEGDVFVHTLLLLDHLPNPCPMTLAWGALLHDVGKPATFRLAPDRIRFDNHVEVGVRIAEEVCRRLRFSGDETEQILALVDNHMRFGHVGRMKESTLKKFLRMPSFDEHLALHRADSLASHRNLSTYEFLQQKRAEIPPENMRPAPLVTGDDLIASGHAPGPKFREILNAVEDAQLEGRLLSRADALEFVHREFPA